MLNLEILQSASALASNAFRRQTIVAKNIANSDTPGFRAQELEKLQLQSRDDFKLKMSSMGHFAQRYISTDQPQVVFSKSVGSASPNGNNVSLEQQMMSATEIQHQHELALGVYQKSLSILRAGLGRR